jgi:DNA-binding transcriptional regulator WhiA
MYKKNHKQLAEYKKTLKLSIIQREVLVGTLLGDASISKQKTKLYNVKLEQEFKNSDYIIHLYNIFKDWVGTEPKIRFIKGKDKFKEGQSIWFRTYRHSSFLFYYNIFYGGYNKRVPKNIKKLFTAVSLSYWFMDDGSKARDSYNLNTQGFNFSDQKRLIKLLNSFDLDARIYRDRNYYLINIRNINKFNELVNPHILDSMKYKLHK